MYIERKIDILTALKNKSLFLLGPRQTGKSSLIHHILKNYRVYNLLKTETFVKLSRSPQRIREEASKQDKIIIIDEIQRLPELLNEVHFMIEELGIHFLLTGSSARKLRRGGINLLGGRAHLRYLHPLSFCELKEKFNLDKAINFGLLPSIYLSKKPDEDLESYIGLYLQEEIVAESIVRNIPAFSRFLQVAALCNGKIINYTNISNDAQVARSTIQEYFQILKDTLIAHELPAWQKSLKRKAITTSKFYLFDTGITRMLQNRNLLNKKTPEYGEAFEAYIFHELKTFADYMRVKELAYWRSTSGFEVDFILANTMAIEIKAKDNISPQDLKGLKALREEKKLKHYIVVCFEQNPRISDGIQILPWKIFLEKLWGNELI
ncbi:MAG: ATP-binding protein [Gammaproteobacteria bacterium]|nr:ATP-binding protein [Gammaproteobacteria bacterium]